MAAVIDRTLQLADNGVLRVPEGQPIPVEKFSEAVSLAEAPRTRGQTAAGVRTVKIADVLLQLPRSGALMSPVSGVPSASP